MLGKKEGPQNKSERSLQSLTGDHIEEPLLAISYELGSLLTECEMWQRQVTIDYIIISSLISILCFREYTSFLEHYKTG